MRSARASLVPSWPGPRGKHYIRVELRDPELQDAYFRIRDHLGGELLIRDERPGRLSVLTERQLVDAKSEVFTVAARATTLTTLGQNDIRIPITLVAGDVTVIRDR